MPRRYLYGPTPRELTAGHLLSQRRSGRCLTFNESGSADLTVKPDDSWESILARLPADWLPDFIVLRLAYTSIPAALWTAPVPLVGLAGDWNLLWHYYRHCAPGCELILTDRTGVDTFARAEILHVAPANLYGCERDAIASDTPATARDIDILFVGNLHPAVQRERLPWLARLARLSERYRVLIAAGVFGADYRRLLARARIVFNRSIRQECNQRTAEAVAAGALLFQEADNREVPDCLRNRQECVYYTADNLDSLLKYYLEHEDQRQAIAQAAHAKVQQFGYDQLWEAQLDQIECRWPDLQARVAQRLVRSGEDHLRQRLWQMLGSLLGDDPALVGDLQAALRESPSSAFLHNALGLASAVAYQKAGPVTAAIAETVAAHFTRACTCDPSQVLIGLNRTEALAELRQTAQAVEQAQQTLAMLDTQAEIDPAMLDVGHFPPAFHYFRVEWEQAAWAHAGNPVEEGRAKHTLLAWRLRLLLGELTGDLAHYTEAVRLRPDLPSSRAALGTTLYRSGRAADAVPHLQEAMAANPFDHKVARTLFEALGQAGDETGQQRLIHSRRLLARAAPGAVPAEDWFADVPAVGPRRGPFAALALEDFERRFGVVDTREALTHYTNAQDTNVVLTLLAHAQPGRILEIGTAQGHMTANFTRWSRVDAVIFSLGTVTDQPAATPMGQRHETPDRAAFGRHANAFGQAGKVCFITADSLRYDFRRLAPIDFVFIDGAHDAEHVQSDTLGVYENLSPGGWLVWHDFGSPAPWVEVRQTLEQLRLSEPIIHVTGTGVAFLRKALAPAPRTVDQPASEERVSDLSAGSETTETSLLTATARPAVVTPAARISHRVAWEGGFQDLHSMALVNRQLCRQLVRRGHDVTLRPRAFHPALGVPRVALPPELRERLARSENGATGVHVRHEWPPNFTPPPEGHWVMVQPWEFGSLPQRWLGPMTHRVDEVWVYTHWLRDCYIRCGIPAEQVHVVPLGIDPAVFRSQAEPMALPTNKRYKFLFVGGTIHRKGIDLLLEAYTECFTADDDVCLVVKDMGAGTFYRGQTAEQRIAQLRDKPGAPAVAYLDQPLTDEQLAALYTACDCLVHPYRGEGFGLPIAEAMACGLPVIVTGYGAALDFCTDRNAYLLPAREVRFSEKRIGDEETVDYPWLAEPDRTRLVQYLRHVVAHPDEARATGRAGHADIHARFTWDQAAAVVEERLQSLQCQPIRRQTDARLAAKPALPAPTPRPRVSLCMIVKNEEANLPTCLGSVADLVDEVVVVDTGSTDQTRAVAARLGAKVVDFTWVDDFAAARNASLDHAQGDWILWLDGDESFDATNRTRLRTLLAGLTEPNAAYVMKQRSPSGPIGGGAVAVDQVRLFPRRADIRWSYRVHEQILPALRQAGVAVRWSDVIVHHAGYQDPALRQRKAQRDERLLRLDQVERPDDPFTLFNLGTVYLETGRAAEALPLLRRSLERSGPRDSIVRKLYVLIAQCLNQLRRPQEAIATCQEGCRRHPDDAELLFQDALLRREQKDLPGAEVALLRLLALPPAKHFASVDEGLRGYKARHNLALVYADLGRTAEAECQWQMVVTDQPAFLPAWQRLGELFVQQQRWADLERVIASLARQPGGDAEAMLLQVRSLWGRRELTQARQLAEAVVAKLPQAVRPRRLLSQFLWETDRDAAATEQCLRALLALVPDDREANERLASFRQPRPVADTPLVVSAGVEPPAALPLPTGSELASLIILCCNALDYTRLCLESVLEHTRAPYELVLVDNGSTDGTPAYLESLRTRAGPQRIVLLRNETNRGFPAACNQALAHAQGRYLVFLNNDTIVTNRWLNDLVKCARHQWPQVGLVGPSTNWPPPHSITVDYHDLNDMPAFAARRRRQFRGQAAEVTLLSGFCLLARREVLDRIGAFDERFGVGYFEDTDLCRRARRAGFKMLQALDVFVHHFGGRTFQGLQIDHRRQLKANSQVFRDKWRQANNTSGREGSAPEAMPSAAPPTGARPRTDGDLPPPGAPPTATRPRVSLCMIVKNEAATLGACLASVHDLVDEMMVVDTGSTDRTKEVAASHGARVVDFTWVEDFSAARNESIRQATGEWIFWLDADERLDEADRRKFRTLVARLKRDNAAYVMRQLSTTEDPLGSRLAVDQIRLFRRDPAVCWEYRVHEQVLLSIRRAGYAVHFTDIVITHGGYEDPRQSQQKLQRNLRLLQREVIERPDDPITLYHMGQVQQHLGQTQEALGYLRRSLEVVPADYSIRPRLYLGITRGHHRLGQFAEALAACRAGREQYPDDAELLFWEAVLRSEQRDDAAAEECLRRLLERQRSGPHFVTGDVGVRSYKARHLLGQICLRHERWTEAEAQLRSAVAEQPRFLPAWQNLGDLYLNQRRWTELEEAAQRLEPSGSLSAALLRAQAHLARKEHGPARSVLERVIGQAPKVLWPRVLLTRVLLDEGRDPGAAEEALRAVLTLDPTHAEARDRLAALQRTS